MNNQFTKKEAPIQGFAGMGGGAFSRLLTSSGVVLGNRSLRFNDGDSAYLGRTPSSTGNRRTWTWSAWIKRSELSASNSYNALWSTGTDGDNYSTLYIDNNDQLFLQEYTSSTDFQFKVGPPLRDVSAWYHIVVAFDSTQSTDTNRMKIYINNVQQDSTGTRVNPSLNYDSMFNLQNGHSIGRNHAYNNFFFSGYITDIHFIDGSALTPSSFGSADSNGVWQRSTYSGSYGTNGYHVLDFANDGTIGNDTSGQGNNYTANNFSTTAGSGNDVLFDFPTNETENTDSGAGGEVIGNYCVFNFLNKGNDITLSNGNLQAATTSSPKDGVFGTIGVSSGKWYWEVELTSSDGNTNAAIGIAVPYLSPDASTPSTAGAYFYSSYNGNKWLSSADSSYGASYTTGDIIGVALDLDNNTLAFYKNGVSQGNATTSLPDGTYLPYVGDNANNSSQTVVANFGQRSFSYSAPANHKCLVSSSLPTPAIADGSEHFDTQLYVGTQATQNITSFEFQPDLIIVKNRDRNAYNHYWVNSIRGYEYNLYSNSTESEHNATRISGFLSNGFSLSSHMGPNYNGENYVAWCWKAASSTDTNNTNGSITPAGVRANQTAGFSMVYYQGTSAATNTVGHGLSKAPEFIILKSTSATDDWFIYHSGLDTSSPEDYDIELNSASSRRDYDTWNDTKPTSTVFSVGNTGASNENGRNYIAYCFAPIEGYSSIGRFIGNADSGGNGPFVYTGFPVKWVLIKGYDSSNDAWKIYDAARSTENVRDDFLSWNNADDEVTGNNNKVDFLSNGFKIRTVSSGDTNLSNKPYIYYAVAENPLQANGGIAR